MKDDLINVLDNENVFQIYAQTVFKYDSEYISRMKKSNRVLLIFFFKRLVVKYHYIFAILCEN